VSESESGTSKTHMTISTSEGARVEMGRDRTGFHHRTAKNSEGIWLYLGYRGSINHGHPFHISQDNIYQTSTSRVIHSQNCLS
jgi:hypothetical protein